MKKYGLKTGDLKVTSEMHENETLDVNRKQKVIAIESRTGTNSIAAIALSRVVGVGDQVKSKKKNR